MTHILVDERLPADGLEAEVVLHVRHHLRRSIRSGSPTAAADLAMLFGRPRSRGELPAWRDAASCGTPVAAGAILVGCEQASPVATLGHDQDHLSECRGWLLERKRAGDAFAEIIALDLSTLLALSRARDLATAKARDRGGAARALPIVIVGETGTGKELLAKAIHAIWAREVERPRAAFHPLHLAGMPASLIYDELFGHGEGSYTGAKKARDGRLVRADGGTLLIDEVGDLPAEAQVALLRFLQDGSLSAIGRDESRTVDVRIIAATWHDLADDVRKQCFRADLYHRLHAGSSLRLEPLRDRRVPFHEIVAALIERKAHAVTPPISHSALEAMSHCSWPGNLRELDGVLDEAISMSAGTTIRLEHLPSQIVRSYLARPPHRRPRGFLADEVDDGVLTPELIAWRITRAKESIAGQPVPAGATESRRLAAFLQQLDDPAPEHAAAIQDTHEAVALEDELLHARTHMSMLEAVLADREMPVVVVDAARAALSRARVEQANLRAGVTERIKKVDASHPWLRVYRDVAGLPLLQGKANTEIAQVIVLLVRAFASFWPAGLAILRSKARESGAAGVVESIRGMLPADFDDSSDNGSKRLKDRKTAASVTTAEWAEVVRSCKSMQEAAEMSGFDRKTIKKRLTEHGVAMSWGEDPAIERTPSHGGPI